MHKRLAILLLSMVLLGMSSCKEQEESKAYSIDDLVGVWALSSAKIYDREAKFLADTSPKDNDGCGAMTWTYASDKLEVLTYVGKDEDGNCLEEVISFDYTLEGNSLKTVDDLGIEGEMLITSLTKDELVFMTALPNPVNDSVNAIKYTEINCQRVE